jgi:peptidoglycan/LPS O-acetylase OafA/YrhL
LGVRVPPSASIDRATLPATSREAAAAEHGQGPEAPPVVAPPPGHPRFPLLDSLRAIAVLCVLLTHTGSLTHTNERSWFGDFTARLDIGVTIFFLISGFLIYRPFVNTRLNGAPATPLVVFFRRRFLRIFPAYWLALTLLAIAPGLPDVHSERWWVYYGLFQAYDPTWFDKGIGTAWSLSTEVAFYLLLPLYAWAVARFVRRSLRVELALIGLLATASVVARALVAHADQDAVFGQASTFPITLGGTFLWFALGMTLAVTSAWLQGRGDRPPPPAVTFIERRPWVPWLLAFAFFVLVSKGIGITGSVFAQLSVAQNVGEHLLYGAVTLCLLLPAVFGDRGGGWPRRVLANRWLAMLGLISYGVFLWHLTIAIKLSGEGAADWLPIGDFLTLTVIVAAVSIPIAALSYMVVERPLLRLKYLGGRAQPSRSASR